MVILRLQIVAYPGMSLINIARNPFKTGMSGLKGIRIPFYTYMIKSMNQESWIY